MFFNSFVEHFLQNKKPHKDYNTFYEIVDYLHKCIPECLCCFVYKR